MSRTSGSVLHSIPFWSPRYNAYMNMDVAPLVLGASPHYREEREVGRELCYMLSYGYNSVTPWGHIIRSPTLKLSGRVYCACFCRLQFEMFTESRLLTVPASRLLSLCRSSISCRNCKGEQKIFIELDTWELLNLKLSTVGTSHLPHWRVLHDISVLQDALKSYMIQLVGTDYPERCFGIEKLGKSFISTTKYYF
ncbi:hypothetical protein MKX08_007948 [Trichoderma sp. CBMAI-0020]|nr:hypothetical protein MKX08_007948 [Trichoderma sp. CBMAI-0020]